MCLGAYCRSRKVRQVRDNYYYIACWKGTWRGYGITAQQGAIRATASLLAIILALLAAFTLGRPWWHGALLGVAAVPLAPVAKDVVSALQAATRALRARS